MRRNLACLALALCAGFATSSAVAGGLSPRLEAYRKVLVDSGSPVEKLGDVLEILVRHELQAVYAPEHFEVTGGLEYLVQGRVAGELDIMVVERPADPALAPAHPEVHVVGEAKLWRNLEKALAKAHEQLQRFRGHHGAGRITSYRYLPDPSRHWQSDYFREAMDYQTWGPAGAEARGFTDEVDLTADEGRLLFQVVSDGAGELRRGLFQDLWGALSQASGAGQPLEALPAGF